MSSDYEKIRKDNIRSRGEDFDDIGILFSERLYSDRTHFIFELLQNAEDAIYRRVQRDPKNNFSKRVQFRLYTDRLEFSHFGDLFNEDDVKAISNILVGTKNMDRQQIGKFGIGFKSVYSFTMTPEIHSGSEHFKIERYIRPFKAETKVEFKNKETLFILPFDHCDFSPEETFGLIENRLKNISIRTLLFLKHINEIYYWIEDLGEGIYTKKEKLIEKGEIVTIKGEVEEERWLKFQKKIQIPEQSRSIGFVEIAFKLNTDPKTQLEYIHKIKSSPLIAYFPTEKETNLGFLIQGPYNTTASRDNIAKDDQWNTMLINLTADLVIETLTVLKKMKLLTISLLETLPIDMEYFSESNIFFPIAKKVKRTLIESKLLPANDGKFVSASGAKLARSAGLRNLLNHRQLSELFDSKIKWLSEEITQVRTPELRKYLIHELKIEEITPESFANKINAEFIEKQKDKWMINFYSFLSDQEALWRPSSRKTSLYYNSNHEAEGPLRSKSIIRLENNEHIQPFDENGQPNAFLPLENNFNFPTVKKKIANDEQALNFLKRLGIRKIGEKEEIESILSTYYCVGSSPPSREENVDHIKKFIRYFKNNRVTKIFEECHILRDNQKDRYWKPINFYLDSPFKTTGLSALYNSNLDNGLDKKELHNDYLEIEGFLNFAESLGIQAKLEIQKTKINREHPDYYHLTYSGGRVTYYERDEDYRIVDLDKIFKNINIEISRLVWDTMLKEESKVAYEARYSPNRSSQTRRRPSSLIYELRNYNWIPNTRGEFCKPAEINKNELYSGFYCDFYDEWYPDWLSAIELSGDSKSTNNFSEEEVKHAGALGLNVELIKIAKDLSNFPDLLSEVQSLIENKKNKVEFPQSTSADPERRHDRLEGRLNDATDKEYKTRKRNVRTTRGSVDPDTWLKNQYTNNEEQMICQICKEEMPFRKRDGEYYFEAVEILSKDEFVKEHEAQFIALCPLCAAMFKEFVKRDETAMNSLKEALMNSDSSEIKIKLGELDTSIKFVETHWIDIKTILNTE